MFTEEKEFIFLLLLLDSGLFYVLDSVSRWILLRRSRRMQILMAMLTGPTPIIRFWPQQRRIASGGMSFDLFSKSDDWCLEFLRFTKEQICEMTYLLDVPATFPDRYAAPPTTDLSFLLLSFVE